MAQLGSAWDETAPADSSAASGGDDALRSFMTQVATVVGEFAFWPGSAASQGRSAASTGEPRPGNLRFMYSAMDMGPGGAGQGFIANAYRSSILGFPVGRNSLWHIGPSGTTCLLAHGSMVEHTKEPSGTPFSARWVVQSDSTSVVVGASTPQSLYIQAFTFATPYNGRPFVVATIDHANGGGQYLCGLTNVGPTGFTSTFSRLKAAGASPITVRYFSLGTVSL